MIDEENCQAGNRQTFPIRIERATQSLGNQDVVSSVGLRGIVLPKVVRCAIDPDTSVSGPACEVRTSAASSA